MFLGISNIGWPVQNDTDVYEMMKTYGYTGLEIAPTRIFPESPYDRTKEAGVWAGRLKADHNFTVPSMQSIWFGRQEKLFGTREERKQLLDYTKKAILFASAVGCGNLVFGCPKNRAIPDNGGSGTAIAFFRELGDYAAEHGTVIGMEANPPIYNTNYINDTPSALALIRQVDSRGFLLNLDTGTMIQNQESAEEIQGRVHLINHVHISEPGLKPIRRRGLHQELLAILREEHYAGCVSIEMGRNELPVIEKALQYVKEVYEHE